MTQDDHRDPEPRVEEQETPALDRPDGRGGRPQEPVERAVQPPPETR